MQIFTFSNWWCNGHIKTWNEIIHSKQEMVHFEWCYLRGCFYCPVLDEIQKYSIEGRH